MAARRGRDDQGPVRTRQSESDGASLSFTCRWSRVINIVRDRDNDPDGHVVAWLIVLPDTIAGLLRLLASRRSGPISLLAAWASHEADHPYKQIP